MSLGGKQRLQVFGGGGIRPPPLPPPPSPLSPPTYPSGTHTMLDELCWEGDGRGWCGEAHTATLPTPHQHPRQRSSPGNLPLG